MKARLALIDDHVMLRNGLANLLAEAGYEIVFQASNGKRLQEKISAAAALPHVVLMDITMPEMDGFESTLWLKKNHPSVKVLALSMLDDESSIIKMLRNGAKGYVLKDSDPEELEKAIDAIIRQGYYHSEMVSSKLIHAMNNLDEKASLAEAGKISLSEKEIEFLRLACTDLSYKEIAGKMDVSPRTVDGYRDALQEKLDCKGRIGLAMWAIRNGIVNP